MNNNLTINVKNKTVHLKMRILCKQDLQKVYILEEKTVSSNSTETYIVPDKKDHLFSWNHGLYLGYFAEDDLIAYSSMRFHKCGEQIHGIYLEKNAAYFVNTLVHYDFRGHNIQCKFLTAREKIAISKGYNVLYATVSPLNIFSLKNIEQFGFYRKKSVVLYGGKQRYIMEKIL